MSQASRQEHYRDEYRRLRPDWKDSLTIYRELVADNLPLGGAVLDLGCGHADWLSLELARASLVCGVNSDLGALRRNVTHRNLIGARAERLPFPAATFDLVTTAWVLEHLEHPAAVLREVRRVLRPEGRFVFLTPNAWNYNVWLIRLVPNACTTSSAAASTPGRSGTPTRSAISSTRLGGWSVRWSRLG